MEVTKKKKYYAVCRKLDVDCALFRIKVLPLGNVEIKVWFGFDNLDRA